MLNAPGTVINDDDPAAIVHGRSAQQAAAAENRAVGAAPADVHVGHGGVVRLGVLRCPGASPGDQAFHIRSGDADNELACQPGERLQDGVGVLLFGRLTGYDHRAGLHVFRVDLRSVVFLLHHGMQFPGVDRFFILQRGEHDRALIEDLPRSDGHARDQSGTRHVGQI